MKFFDDMEARIEEDLELVTKNYDLRDKVEKGRNLAANDSHKPKECRLTRQMVLESAMCEELDDVETLMLRDKHITIFNDNLNDPSGQNLKLDDLVNIECLYASHNLIKDTFGVSQMTTLVELNLSFNAIEDITGLEELTQLRQLHLNHNKIAFIEAIRKLKGLKVLGLFANKIMQSEDVMEILTSLPKLK